MLCLDLNLNNEENKNEGQKDEKEALDRWNNFSYDQLNRKEGTGHASIISQKSGILKTLISFTFYLLWTNVEVIICEL